MIGRAAGAAGRVGILGGMFDPIHLGHTAAAEAAQRALGLERIILVPSRRPPHRPVQPLASAADRVAMATLATEGRAAWSVSPVETTREGPSYTFDTLEEFGRTVAPARRLYFITGADAFLDIATWSRYPAVLDLAHFVVVARPGFDMAVLGHRLPGLASRMTPAGQFIPAPGDSPTAIVLLETATPDVSSTEIRRRAREGESLAGLVPPGVADYIATRGLYAGR